MLFLAACNQSLSAHLAVTFSHFLPKNYFYVHLSSKLDCQKVNSWARLHGLIIETRYIKAREQYLIRVRHVDTYPDNYFDLPPTVDKSPILNYKIQLNALSEQSKPAVKRFNEIIVQIMLERELRLQLDYTCQLRRVRQTTRDVIGAIKVINQKSQIDSLLGCKGLLDDVASLLLKIDVAIKSGNANAMYSATASKHNLRLHSLNHFIEYYCLWPFQEVLLHYQLAREAKNLNLKLSSNDDTNNATGCSNELFELRVKCVSFANACELSAENSAYAGMLKVVLTDINSMCPQSGSNYLTSLVRAFGVGLDDLRNKSKFGICAKQDTFRKLQSINEHHASSSGEEHQQAFGVLII